MDTTKWKKCACSYRSVQRIKGLVPRTGAHDGGQLKIMYQVYEAYQNKN